MSQLRQPQVLLTVHDVFEWRAERADVVRQIENLSAKLAELDRRLAAASLFFDEATIAAASAEPAITQEPPSSPHSNGTASNFMLEAPGAAEKRTWNTIVLDVLNKAGRGLTPAQIAAEIRKTDARAKLDANPNGIYNAISVLVRREEAVRHGSLIYSSYVFEAMKAHGIEIPRESPGEKKEYEVKPDSTAHHIIEMLREHERGLRGSEIIDELRRANGIAHSAVTHTNFVYTVLGKLVKKEKVRKVGMTYSLAQ